MVPVLRAGADFVQRGGLGVVVGLLVRLAVPVDLHVEPRGQRVDHRDADAVQAAGDRVGVGIELAAGVQDRHDDLDGGLALLRVHLGRDAAAVVVDRHAAVGPQRHDHGVGVAGHRLVDRVVDDLPHQVVQAALAGRADVHAGPLADGVQALQHGDRGRAVFVLLCRHGSSRRSCCSLAGPDAGRRMRSAPARDDPGGSSIGPLKRSGGAARNRPPNAPATLLRRRSDDQIDRSARSVCGDLRAHCGRNPPESTG